MGIAVIVWDCSPGIEICLHRNWLVITHMFLLPLDGKVGLSSEFPESKQRYG